MLVDDDELLLGFMDEHLSMSGYETTPFSSPVDAKNFLSDEGSENIDLVITDVKMNEMTGDELHNYISDNHPHIGVILMTGFGNVSHAVNAMQKGAFDYITKPFNAKEIALRVKLFFSRKEEMVSNSAKDSPRLNGNSLPKNGLGSNSSKAQTAYTDETFVGNDPAVAGLLKILPSIAANNAPIFIQGDSGTGKEVFARQVHKLSNRSDKPYVKINCANLPVELVESTLFGHVKGSFTGAITDRTGAFDEARGGTLLLDEITEIDINVQAKLLRVLQEREFYRVGSQKTIQADVRIIATSNRNIAQAINDGKFREDLYFRLNVFPITIPPLRERKSDIPRLVNHFINIYCEQYQFDKKEVSAELMDHFMEHEWRGNVRELENVIHRGVILSHDSNKINKEHIDNEIFSNVDFELANELLTDIPLMSIEDMELQLIKKTMEHTRGNQKKAAKILGITDRTIRNKLKQLQL